MKRFFMLSLGVLASTSALLMGCDDSVKATVLDGVQSGTTAIVGSLISAMFQSLMNDTADTSAMLDASAKLVAMVF